MKQFAIFLAQGFGIGRIPVAPGTFGSMLGIALFASLLWLGTWAGLLVGTLVTVCLSIWLCGVAEKALGQTDPGSVVLDEIAAMPICFLGWVWIFQSTRHRFPRPEDLMAGRNWLVVLGVFAAFRLFDVLKPWPVGKSQKLPGGWGITIDDVLAAVYVNVVMVLVKLVWH